MRTTTDVLRSMNRYVALVLGDEWEVRLAADDVRHGAKFAVVSLVGPTLYSGPAIYQDAIQPMQVAAYQAPAESNETGLVAALVVEETLFGGFSGKFPSYSETTNDATPVTRTVRTGSRRVPLYDYSGVPLDGVNAGTFARNEHDYMRVLDFSTSRLSDPVDDRAIVVLADIRVTWRRPTHADPGKPVESIEVQFAV